MLGTKETNWPTRWPKRGAVSQPRKEDGKGHHRLARDNNSNATPGHTAVAFGAALDQAAKAVFKPHIRKPTTPWISDATLQALAVARTAQASLEEGWKTLKNRAKRMARQDKVHWIHRQLEEDPGVNRSTVWNTVRRQRKGFVGTKRHLIKDGIPQPWSKAHEVFRDHLQDKQWGVPDIPDHTADRRRNRANIYDQAPDEAPFTIMDLHEALGKLKKRKAPGPDGMVNELFLALDREGEEIFLGIYNDAWEQGNTPQNWGEATVVTILKGKGTDTDPANYRPISLLNVMYKIYASMIQSRLAKLIEPRLRHTQFGFRPHRSTQQPLFTLRRAIGMVSHDQHAAALSFCRLETGF